MTELPEIPDEEPKGFRDTLRNVAVNALPIVAGASAGASIASFATRQRSIPDGAGMVMGRTPPHPHRQAITLGSALGAAAASKVAFQTLTPAQWSGAIRIVSHVLLTAGFLWPDKDKRLATSVATGFVYLAGSVNQALNGIHKHVKESPDGDLSQALPPDVTKQENGLLYRVQKTLGKIKNPMAHPLEFTLATWIVGNALLLATGIHNIKRDGLTWKNGSTLAIPFIAGAQTGALLYIDRSEAYQQAAAMGADSKLVSDAVEELEQAMNPLMRAVKRYVRKCKENPMQLSMDIGNIVPVYLMTLGQVYPGIISIAANITMRSLRPEDHGRGGR